MSYEAANYRSNAERISSDQCWRSGYRIDLIYNFCACLNDVRVRWTHFPSFSNSDKTEGFFTPLFPYQGISTDGIEADTFASDVMFHDTFDFYYFDFLVGRKAINCGCFTVDLQGGIQYGHLYHKEKTFFVFPDPGSSVPIQILDKAKSRLWGIGPEINTELSCSLGNCFSLTGRGCGALLISKREIQRKVLVTDVFITTENNFSFKNRDYWKVIPTLDLRFGLSFSHPFDSCFCSGPFTFDLEIGYEAIWVFQGVERIKNPINQNEAISSLTSPILWGINFDELMTFSLHGPYVHLGITF